MTYNSCCYERALYYYKIIFFHYFFLHYHHTPRQCHSHYDYFFWSTPHTWQNYQNKNPESIWLDIQP